MTYEKDGGYGRDIYFSIKMYFSEKFSDFYLKAH